jgi:hypothetical protein
VRCTVLTTLDSEQCTTDADCLARGPDFEGTVCVEKVCQAAAPVEDPEWACVGQVAAPSNAPYTAKLVVIDAVTQKPLPDASVKLCAKLDPQCATPIQSLTLAADGSVSLTVPSDANDYLLIELAGYVPLLSFIDPGGALPTITAALVTTAGSAALNQTVGVTADPEKGSIYVSVTNCLQERAEGVHVDLDPLGSATPFYSIASALSKTATETDGRGSAGFINANTGVVTLTATVASTGEVLAQVTTLVVAGAVTQQPMHPSVLP